MSERKSHNGVGWPASLSLTAAAVVIYLTTPNLAEKWNHNDFHWATPSGTTEEADRQAALKLESTFTDATAVSAAAAVIEECLRWRFGTEVDGSLGISSCC